MACFFSPNLMAVAAQRAGGLHSFAGEPAASRPGGVTTCHHGLIQMGISLGKVAIYPLVI